ncbi:uncharacterized protein LOC135846430 isoform X2 [Planococcus citri]|uniref:uncharacterized protein LOC135846430 isoform X2 n=1 Tax=Planococcus citri TaxID=170843 RepID=UPI0031F8C810
MICLHIFDDVTVTPQPTLNEANQIIPETSSLTHLQARICKKVLPQTMEITGEDRAIFVGASAFKEFIRRNNFYTDNSGLIREIIHSKAKVILITAAQRCGKTMNLKMIQTFLEIPVAENGSIFELNSTFAYNYFANGVVVPSGRDHMNVSVDPPPMISNFPVDISEHLGKYPVIHIDFANVDPNVNSVRSKIAEIFNVHEYSLLPYKKIYKEQSGTILGCNALTIIEKFDNITKGQVNEYELIRSICFLSKLLFEFHNRTKVVILIDEYDHFINQLISTQFDHKKLLTFYGNFLIASVKSNTFYSTRAVLTGTTRVAELTGLLNSECSSVFSNIMELNDFDNFYGITKLEKEEMLKLAKDPKYSPKHEKFTKQQTRNEANPTIPEGIQRRQSHHQAQICKKVPPPKGAADRAGSIFIGSSTFDDFIRESHFYADKSGLILEIIQSHAKVLVITAARRWGKTMNLKMIQMFLEIPMATDGSIQDLNTTFAYNYFTNGVIVPLRSDLISVSVDPPPMISNFPVDISEHLGKYPVIHIDFVAVGSRTSISDVKYEIAEIFEKHAYSVSPYRKIYNDHPGTPLGLNALNITQRFQKILERQIDDEEIIDSISFLSELLFKFHKKKVVILIDEYDNFINRLVLPQFDKQIVDLENLLKFYRSFLIASVKTNIYLERAVLTGIIRIAELAGLSNWEAGSIEHINTIEPSNFSNFYGITKQEMEAMLELAEDPEYSPRYEIFMDEDHIVDQVMNYYDGYSSYGENAVSIFNVLSLVEFINEAILDDYWFRTSSIYHYWKLFRFAKFNHAMSKLYDGLTIPMPVNAIKDINTEALNRIYDFIRNTTITDEFTEQDLHTTLSLLSFMGYVTAQKNSLQITDTSATFQMRLPNFEIKMKLFHKWLKIIVEPKIDNLVAIIENRMHLDGAYSYLEFKSRLEINMTGILVRSAKSTNVSTYFPYLKTTLNILFNTCRTDILQENTYNIMTVWNNSLKTSTFDRILELWAPIAKVYQCCYNISS